MNAGKVLTKIFGSRNERLIKRYMRVVQAVADSRARNEWVEIKR